MKLSLCIAGTAALSALLFGNAASAQVLYNNLPPQGTSGGTSGLTLGPEADSFSTGAASVSLSDVQLLLEGNPTSSASYTVELLSDSATSPGSMLTTLGSESDSSLSSTPTVVDFSLATPYALSANTRYWIELSGPSSTVEWSFTATNTGTGVGSEYNYFAGSVFANSVFTPYQMKVTATSSVPEPGAYALLGSLTLTGAALLRRRRARRR